MAETPRARRLNAPRTPQQERDALAELGASRRDLAGAITRQIAFYVEHFETTPEEARERATQPPPDDAAEKPADQVGWWELSNLLTSDPGRGQALWHAIKDDARQELSTGLRVARSLEVSTEGRPYDRAQWIVVYEALCAGLRPRDGLEHLLVQQMASAFELHLRWQAVAVRRTEEESWHGERDRRTARERMSPRQRERDDNHQGWLPPRQTDAQAIEQATTLADRYQRTFLRLLKAFRDTRRLIGHVTVAGGTLNVTDGPQHVNVAAPPAPASTGRPPAPRKTRRAPRVKGKR